MPEPFSGSFEDLTDVPEAFPPTTHTHTKSQITDLSLGWSDITGKPETFTPSSHTHTKSDITDLSLAWADITGKPETFTPSAHGHQSTDITQSVTTLAESATSPELADGGMYAHTPSSAPIYTLPAIPQAEESEAHEIVVDVKFSANALSVAFEDASRNTVPITPDFEPAANDVYRFLCAWTTLSGWAIKAVPLEVAE